MVPAPSVIDLMGDPALLGAGFAGSSWDMHRAVLRAAYALPMTEREVELFKSVAERDPPTRRVRELWEVVGRGGGKDSIAAAIASHAALGAYATMLRPGERAVVFCIACDRDQSRIALNYIRGNFRESVLLAAMVERETADGLELNNGVDIVVATNSFRAVRGRTIASAILDECAFYRADESASPDVEVYAALRPGLARMPGSILVGISSPYRRAGLLYDKWAKHYGKAGDVLVVRGASRTFNPTLPIEVVEEAIAEDPARARAEYLAEWRTDISGFLDRELIEAAVDRGLHVRPPVGATSYRAFADPSGGEHDDFTAAVAHREGERVVLDALVVIKPPFNPSQATEEIAALLKSYHLTEVTGDHYAAQWTIEAFRKCGIRYNQSERVRSEIYLDALPLFTSGRARLLDNPRLIAQFCALERKTFSTGRDRVDHGQNGHDDLANSVAGALVLAAGTGGTDWAALGAADPADAAQADERAAAKENRRVAAEAFQQSEAARAMAALFETMRR